MSQPINGYNERQHGGLEVPPSDGLILYTPTAGLEVVQDANHGEKQTPTTATVVEQAPTGEDVVQEEQTSPTEKKPRVSRKCLWILIAVLMVMVMAAVGGGVGGGIAASHKCEGLACSPTSTTSSGTQPTGTASPVHTSYSPSTTSSGQSTSTASSLANTIYWGNDKAVSIGCYIDKFNRILTGPLFTDATSMTPQLCAGLCSKYTYFGLEDASQCFCGNVLTSGYSKTSYSDCNTSCTGNSNEFCGNSWRIDVYQLTAAKPPVKNYNSLGCYNDAIPRILQGPEYQNAWVTPQLCAGLCNNYTFFGVEYGEQCFCDNGYNSTYTQAADSECNYHCAGDSSQTCGGYWTIDLYSFG